MARMNKADIATTISNLITTSTWFDDTETQAVQKAALDSYHGRSRAPNEEGCSAAVSQDFADMVEAVVSQIMPAFDFASVAEFDPHGPGDVDQARLESRVINSKLRNSNDGYITIQAAIRNVLILRNGLLKVYTHRREDKRTEKHTDLDALELAQTLEPTAPNQVVTIVGEREISGEEGTPAERATFTLKRVTTFKSLKIEPTDPTQFLVTKQWTEPDLANVPMCGERYFLTVSDLIGLGLSKKKALALPTTETDTNVGSLARDDGTTADRESPTDPSMREVECFEIYALMDVDGDGVAERHKVIYAGGATGGEVVIEEVWPQGVPWASGTAFLQSNRWRGMSLYDKEAEVEEIKTEALRQWLDNLKFMNTNELLGVDGLYNENDLAARRPGGINRVDDISAVSALVVQDTSGASLSLLDYMDKVRAERGGAALDMQSAEMQLAGKTTGAIDRQMDPKELLARMMTATIAETLIRQTFKLIHETMRRDFPEPGVQRVGASEFLEYAPGNWQYRVELTITAGMTAHERQEKRGAMESTLIQQEKLQQAGLGAGILVDMSTYYSTLVDWLTASGVKNAGRYWVDPRTEASVKAQQEALKQSQAAQQQQQQAEDKVISAQLAIEHDKNASSRMEKEMQLAFNRWETTIQTALKEVEIDAQHGTDESEPAQVDALQAQGAN